MEHRAAFPALGTNWSISSRSPLTSGTARRITARVQAFDRTYSRFRTDSLVAEVRRHPGTHRFPHDARALFALYRQLYDCTDGAVTPLVGQALEHLGYGVGYRLTSADGRVAVPRWDDVLSVDGSTVTTSEPVMIDVGAAGKGYLVDLIGQLLDDSGVTEYVIDASGDLLHRGSGVERVGLEDPDDPQKVIGIARVSDGALCASTTERRRWGDRLHHIIDPTTGTPTAGVVATWVTHASCAIADGLATALFVSEPDQLKRRFDFGYVRLDDRGGVTYSSDFDGRLFT